MEAAFYKNFESLKTSYEKTKFCLKFMSSERTLPTQHEVKAEKNEAKSTEARKRGNDLFMREKNYLEAMKAYNESLCFAPLGSETMAIGYANRSAIYYYSGFFRFCVENIDLALENPYPDHLRPKLVRRKEKCLERMVKEKDASKVFGTMPSIQLSYAPNPEIPGIIDALKCVDDEKFGRHIVTTQYLKPGDVILTETSFVTTLHVAEVYSQCANCGFQSFFNLKPCPKSTMAMFCSDACGDEAWNRFYKYEHAVIDGIFKVVTRIVGVFAIRATLKAFTMCKDIAELKRLIGSIGEGEHAFQLDYTTATEREKFRAFYSLAAHTKEKRREVVFVIARATALSWYIFKEFTDLKELLEDKEHEELFVELLFRFAEICDINSQAISNPFSGNEADASSKVASYGTGVSLLYSLMNHSCAPNVARFPGMNAIYVIRPIKSGEQLFDCYGPSYASTEAQDRKVYLKSKYCFDCSCEACCKCFPVFDYKPNLMVKLSKPLQTAVMSLIDLATGTGTAHWKEPNFRQKWRRDGAKYKTEICKFLAENDHRYPCAEISVLLSLLKYCFSVIYCDIPIKDIFSVI